MKESNEWNATNYNNHADFVYKLAMPVVELLDPKDKVGLVDYVRLRFKAVKLDK